MMMKKTKRFSNPFLWLAVFLAAVAALAALRVGAPPEISIQSALPGLGRRTPVTVEVAEPRRGLSRVRLELAQGDHVWPLAERLYTSRPFWDFRAPEAISDRIELEVGADSVPDLSEGEATLRVTADRAATWLRRPDPVVATKVLPVRLRPPALSVTSIQTYVAQGGSEAVVYRVGESAVKDGVRVGEWWFPGYPLPGGGKQERFALFGVPHDFIDEANIRVVAIDEVENMATRAFVDRFITRPLRTDTIQLSDRFMERVVPSILAESPQVEAQNTLLESYLAINRDLRRLNTEALAELAERTQAEFLWNRPFRALPNAQAMASFADRRSYLYEGRKVDQQDHLGFDLASYRRAPVVAANSGLVILAEYFGIYGNAVVLDHGYGLMSLYAHLSSIGVEVGERVSSGEELGRTGETGLAGGDHLHFSMLLHGLQVNPLEWWDGHWIRDRIARKLDSGFEFEDR